MTRPTPAERTPRRPADAKTVADLREEAIARLIAAAKKVLEWSWEDCDAEPQQDMKQMDAALEDLDAIERIANREGTNAR